MISARASFACTVNAQNGQIYVVGGKSFDDIFNKCEAYSILNDHWFELPSLNEAKCSASLCVLDGKLLFCFGGVKTNDFGGNALVSTIEVLDLNRGSFWKRLSFVLPFQVCDIGAFPIDEERILLCGGWNSKSLRNSFILHRSQSVTIEPHHRFLKTNCDGLQQPDFFLSTGTALCTND